MLPRIHAAASILAFMLIILFWLATVIVEINGDPNTISMVKSAIAAGLLLLIPAMIISGISGSRLVGKSTAPIILKKRNRLKVAAANGILLLVPCAVLLWQMAAAGQFTTTFYVIQSLELIAGSLNAVLLGLNIRDGLRLSGKLGKSIAASPPSGRGRRRHHQAPTNG